MATRLFVATVLEFGCVVMETTGGGSTITEMDAEDDGADAVVIAIAERVCAPGAKSPVFHKIV
jgi:hypothetical protein